MTAIFDEVLLHTMATPQLTAADCVRLAARLGFDGIELIVSDSYGCAITLTDDPAGLLEVATSAGVRVGALTSYVRGLDAADPATRRTADAELRATIDLAAGLRCPRIRVLGGADPGEPEPAERVGRLAAALHRLGAEADRAGVQLLVENHQYTLADSAARTRRIVDLADSPAVGIVYDQANLAVLGAEESAEAITAQAGAIRHVHLKNLLPGPTIDTRTPVPLDEGVVDWPATLSALAATGYTGSATWEYEVRWYPDLPPAQTAAPHLLDLLAPWRLRTRTTNRRT